jgi:hypothetical protein
MVLSAEKAMFRALLAVTLAALAAVPSRAASAVKSSAGQLADSTTAAAPFNGPRLNAFLAAQSSIRIAVTDAPGNGHQAIGAIIAKRVRQLGFSGRYKFIYDPAVKYKLDLTLPGFDPSGPDVQNVAAFGATAVPWDGFLARGYNEVNPLSIISADHLGANPNLKSVVTAKINPWGWGEPTITYWDKRNRKATIPLIQYRDHPVLFPAPRIDDAGKLIEETMNHTLRLREKIGGLHALTAGLDTFEMLPAYGLSAYPDNVFHLMNGIWLAQRRAPQLFRAGVVVPMFSWLNDMDISNLTWLLAGSPGLAADLRMANIRDAGAVAGELAALRKGQILLLHVGGVAQDVFDYFFSKQTMPGTVVGANGQNFMRVLGLPYINTLGENPLTPSRNLDRKIRNLMRISQSGLGNQSAESLARFLVETKRPNSRVARTMARLRPTSDAEDKIALVLNEAVALYDRLSGSAPVNESQRPTANKAD